MGPLYVPLGKAAVKLTLPLKEGQIHLYEPAFRVVVVLPDIRPALLVLRKGIAAQYVFQLVLRRNIEKQQAAHLQRGVCGLEELLGGLQRIEVVHPVAGADYSVLGPVQRELAHVLLHKGYLQRRPSRFFGGYPQHVPGYVHAGHDVPRPGQTQRYLACAAGAVRHPQLFSAQKTEQVLRPGIVIHVLHERVVHAREITIH